jgi:ectoine hydroxylase-related dioxygenase (phytanoyl-CoA dioxygenase family)
MADSGACAAPILCNSNREQWGKPSFWEHICPCLAIGHPYPLSLAADKSDTCIEPLQAEGHRRGLLQQGYARVDEVLDSSLIHKLQSGAEALQQAGYPASFLLLFDETWQLARHSQRILKAATHKANVFNFDILAWCITNNKSGTSTSSSKGFSPHRDRQPANVPDSFHPDGQAKFVTHWIALSQATPENSCLYMIPKPQDPGYMQGDIDTHDPLQRALYNKESYQYIRSFPRTAGTSLLFTHRIIHWGSAREESSTIPPRVAISFVASDPDYEKPYLEQYSQQPTAQGAATSIAPSFHLRLLLVCAQLLIYYQRLHLPRETIQACYQYCKDHEDKLEASYRQKVFLEYIHAMKEDDPESGDANVNEDEEEAILEEMLNAEKGHYGEFEDDFDETNQDDGGSGNYGGAFFGQGDDEEDDQDEEEEGISLFGKRQLAEPENGSSSKRSKDSK